MMNDQTDKPPRAVRETGVQYVVDTEGQRVAVLLPIKEYEHYLEWLKSETGSQSAKAAAHPAQDDSQVITKPRPSMLSLQGLGKEIWSDVDAQEYVDQERASWDAQPGDLA